MHEKYLAKGLVILGFDCVDDRATALQLLRENGVTFLNVLDSSDAARELVFQGYRTSAVPTHYFIDRKGKVVDVWFDYDEERALCALERLL